LLQLPIGEIKLDRSFILNPETDEASLALVEAALQAGLTQLPCKYSYEFVLPETASLSGRDESAALNPNSWYTQNLAILVLLFVPSTVQNATVEMKKPPMIIRQILTAFCATVAVFASAGAAAHGPGDIVKPNFEQAIPNLPGKSLVAVEVEYPPGAGSLPHVHAKSAFIYAYVVSGAVESKVNDGDVRVYRAGESWSEPPGASHPVSRNASKTQPAKLLAIFVVDSNDKELTTPLK
jgi:quercetin dioxygenase-like cupin family protein